jgi:hypothetical protein
MHKFLILASIIAIATPTVLLNPSTPPAQAQTQKSRLKTHAFRNMVFKTPHNWIRNPDGEREYNLIIDKKELPKQGGEFTFIPKGLIRVVASVDESDLETAMKPSPHAIEKTIIKTERLTINGKKAVRSYESYDDGFPAGIITYIATGENETAMLMTFYSDSASEPQAQQIHDSIRITE